MSLVSVKRVITTSMYIKKDALHIWKKLICTHIHKQTASILYTHIHRYIKSHMYTQKKHGSDISSPSQYPVECRSTQVEGW